LPGTKKGEKGASHEPSTGPPKKGGGRTPALGGKGNLRTTAQEKKKPARIRNAKKREKKKKRRTCPNRHGKPAVFDFARGERKSADADVGDKKGGVGNC